MEQMKGENLRKQLRAIRKNKGMSLKDISDKTGTMSIQNIHYIETGKVKINIDNLLILSNALGYEVTITLIEKND